jgi:peptidoglycan/LPS O-acetylase OafA/YrhL
MPWFFFKAGMFFREKPILVEFKASAKRLLIPFALFSFFGACLEYAAKMSHEGFTTAGFIRENLHDLLMGGALESNPPLWFLFSLFFARIIFNILFKKLPDYIIAIIGLLAAGAFLYAPLDLPHYFGNISAGLFFLAAGHFLKDKQFKLPFLIASIVTFIAIYAVNNPQVDMHLHHVSGGSYFLWLPASLAGIVILDHIARIRLLEKTRLQLIGKDSMTYYVWHWLVIVCVSIVVKRVLPDASTELKIALYTIACVIILPLTVFIQKHLKSCKHSETSR